MAVEFSNINFLVTGDVEFKLSQPARHSYSFWFSKAEVEFREFVY